MATAQPTGTIERQTRDRLLEVAERLFAEHGYAATSVRDITAEAGCNVAAVSYHFRGKQGLYEEVFRRRLGVLRTQRLGSLQEAMREGGGQPTVEHVLRAFADAFLEPLVEGGSGQRVMELIAREMLDPQLPPQLFVSEIVVPVRGALRHALLRLLPGADERRIALCIQSFIAQLLQAVHAARLAFQGTDEVYSSALPEVVEHIVCFSAAGIRASAGGPTMTTHDAVARGQR